MDEGIVYSLFADETGFAPLTLSEVVYKKPSSAYSTNRFSF